MDTAEWAKLLKSYRTPKRVVAEALEGIVDHIETSCTSGHTVTLVKTVPRHGGRTPFVQGLTTCDRGTRGCNLKHNDSMALVFARMSLERLAELTN